MRFDFDLVLRGTVGLAALIRSWTFEQRPRAPFLEHFGLADNAPECELGMGCIYSSPSARFSALHRFQAFGNSEKPPRNNALRGALGVE